MDASDKKEVIDLSGEELQSSTSTDIAVQESTSGGLGKVPSHLVDAAKADAEGALSQSTRRAYASDWHIFVAWCNEVELAPLPTEPQTVALFCEHLADQGRAAATIQRALITISRAHRLKGCESPISDALVRAVLKGLRNRLGVAQHQAQPLLPEHLRRGMFSKPPVVLRDFRDRAVIADGLAGGFRRSEIASLNVEDLEFNKRGVTITVRRGKTDQAGVGYRKGIPHGQFVETCPIRALRNWLEQANITTGPVFREITVNGTLTERRMSSQAINRTVKKAAKLAQLDPDRYSGHSLRAGFVTAAQQAGKRIDRIMDMTGHKSEKMMRKYTREADLYDNNAAEGIGL